jgi:hypothetical protein
MNLRSTTPRVLVRVGGILLLWLLSVADGFAAPPRTGKPCDPQTQTTSIRRLIRQAQLVGGPVAKRVGRSLFRVRPPRTAHVERTIERATTPDEQAIQNDAPIAHAANPPVLSLEPLGIFTDRLERLPFTPFASPHSPRGPPDLL